MRAIPFDACSALRCHCVPRNEDATGALGPALQRALAVASGGFGPIGCISTMVEGHKEYVQAARVIGVPALRIMLRHVLPNVMGPVLVL